MTPTDAAPDDGYRPTPRGGPRLRTDIIDVYIFRRRADAAGTGARAQFLQLLRASDPLGGTWQPVMGHVEAGETALQTALREAAEEVGLLPRDADFISMWALEQVHPYYIAALDAIVLSPRFCVEVAPTWEPTLNPEHSRARWTTDPALFMWPGSRRAVEEVLEHIVAGSDAEPRLRVDLSASPRPA
ncbi:MAG: NUDIX domain-containing protein [Planctomycetota bacterium]|nr:NUDIX domain-containing protein [Planctomycetota bacterium]